jgi:hypothetical protein
VIGVVYMSIPQLDGICYDVARHAPLMRLRPSERQVLTARAARNGYSQFTCGMVG